MWTVKDIEKINPPGKRQKASILSHLVKIGATWLSLLSETANDMEKLGSPWVCCFSQLPYPILVENGEYIVKGQSANSIFHLDFKLFTIDLSETFQIKVKEIKPDEISSYKNAPIGTQIRAFTQLSGRRVLYHDNYLSCLGRDGLKDQIINPRKSEWVVTSGKYTGKIMSSSVFEGEVADRLRPEMLTAIKRFLLNYSLVALYELPTINSALNYFLMPAPGRVAYGCSPSPLLPTMLRTFPTTPLSSIPKNQLDRALQFSLREIDKYLHQLFAMHRLAHEGEEELALIGCVTAIEWYMNSFLQHPDDWQFSLTKCLKLDPFKSLPEKLKQALRGVASSRNEVVHGQPPDRRHHKRSESSTNLKLVIKNALEIGLELYREMNLNRAK